MQRSKLAVIGAALAMSLGLASPASAVVGGRQATPIDNPSMVGLVQHGEPATDALFCGGALVAPTVVVSAMHCISDMRGSDAQVASEIDVIGGALLRSDASLRTVRVAQIVRNPGWDEARTLHDILVLKLAAPLPLPPLALAGPADAALSAPGSVLRATGWGLTDFRDDNSQPDALKEADIPVVPDEVCSRIFGDAIFDGTFQFCGQAPGGKPDTCQGDSGGPLVGGSAEAARLVGVVSYGPASCGQAGGAAVYADVASERNWIAAAGGLGLPVDPVAPVAPAPPKAKRTVKTRIGAVSCGVKTCRIDVRTKGKNSSIDEVVLRVVRKQQGQLAPAKRFVRAKKIRSGFYRARTLLPYGVVTVTAVAYDAAGSQLGRPAKETFEVE